MPSVDPVKDTAAGSPQPNVSAVELSPRLWAAVLATGLVSGLMGGLLMKLLRVVQHSCYEYASGDFLLGVEHVAPARRVSVMLLAGVLCAGTLWLLRRFGQSGGTDPDDAIWKREGAMSLRHTTWRALLSIVGVGMGVALGREGALKQAGAVAGSKLGEVWGLTHAHRRLLVACGAGAGMAAAYNVPFGGSLFTAEVLLGSMTLSTLLPAFAACFTGVAVSWLMLPNEPAYRIPELHANYSGILWALLAGPLLGLVSVGYVRAVAWAENNKTSGWQVAGFPLLACAALGVMSVPFPALLGNGKNIVQITFADGISAGLLCWLIVLRPAFSLLCLRSGIPGGLFTPTMTLGALMGYGLGRLWQMTGAAGEMAGYALVGSGAFLGAATLGPLSSAAFLLELTRGADSLMVPLLVATVGATVTARTFEVRSIYSARV